VLLTLIIVVGYAGLVWRRAPDPLAGLRRPVARTIAFHESMLTLDSALDAGRWGRFCAWMVGVPRPLLSAAGSYSEVRRYLDARARDPATASKDAAVLAALEARRAVVLAVLRRPEEARQARCRPSCGRWSTNARAVCCPRCSRT
jgi:hypothetical protein